jgi:hypothetical protein
VDSGLPGCDAVSLGKWLMMLQKNVVLSYSVNKGPKVYSAGLQMKLWNSNPF